MARTSQQKGANHRQNCSCWKNERNLVHKAYQLHQKLNRVASRITRNTLSLKLNKIRVTLSFLSFPIASSQIQKHNAVAGVESDFWEQWHWRNLEKPGQCQINGQSFSNISPLFGHKVMVGQHLGKTNYTNFEDGFVDREWLILSWALLL